MPRNGSGVASKPAGTTATPNTTVRSAQFNDTVNDIYQLLNDALPITAGGTGGATAVAGADNLSTKGSDIASATTTDIGAATGRYVNITGTTTITGLGTKTAGVVRICTFTGSLTLTHNATSLILPGGANIQTAANDVAVFVSEGSGNWRCVNFQRQSDNWVDVASATTTDIGAAASQNVRVTGTTTITGLGTVAAGTFRRVRFADALTLTHNGTSLILPGSANITTAAGDVAEFISEGSGNWRCVDFTPASGLNPQVQPISKTATGVGQIVAINASATALVMPSGGTWEYEYIAYFSSTGAWAAGAIVGVAAGGATVVSGAANTVYVCRAKRIQA